MFFSEEIIYINSTSNYGHFHVHRFDGQIYTSIDSQYILVFHRNKILKLSL